VIDVVQQPFAPTWHTTADTPEHVSASSLQQVGDVLVEVVSSSRGAAASEGGGRHYLVFPPLSPQHFTTRAS
jgi:hypothetical protein